MRRVRKLGRNWKLVSGSAVAAAMLASCSSASAPTTGSATSRFDVGVRHETLVDQSRSTPANGSLPGHPGRVLETTVFYPAEGKAGAVPRTGATPDRASAPYPLIVFAHGFGGSVDGYQALLLRWAEAGYVVAAPLFPLTRDSAPGGPDLADFANQPADLSFVITQVLQESARSGDPLYKMVDAHRIGAAGHSLGGVTILGLVANTCCRDARVTAAVVMSGDPITFPTGKVDFSSAPPLLLVHGDADQAVPYSASIDAFNSAKAPKGLLTIRGGDHDSPVRPTGKPFPSVVRTTVGFFDRYLKQQSTGVADLASDASRGATILAFEYRPGQHVYLAAPPTVARNRRATVSPSRGLVDGQTLQVTWNGYAPGVSVNVLECSKSPPTAAGDCDLQTAKLLQPDPKGYGSLAFAIHTGAVGTGTCSATHPGCVVVVNEGGSLAPTSSVITPVSFAP
ncbi:MAG TPA: neocarzinostatin apoprotein domain-containing protein [Acidimicrobiales bacterium]|nr:neocarzinostatin apoprotein domain-containing protein [Acidimicrobiales bacterium]